MTFGTTAMWLGSTTHTSKVARNVNRATFGGPTAAFTAAILPTTAGGAHGVVGGGDLLVTATGGLNFSIAAGNAVLTGSSSIAQGVYAGIYNDAALAGAVGAHHATLPRKDIIAVRIRDTDEDASGSEDCGHVVIAGTAAASPADPAIPANHLVLARANVPATSGAITVDDLRTFASAIGGRLRCRSTTRPTGAALWEGLQIYETDTDLQWTYNGSAWVHEDFGYVIKSGQFVGTTGLSANVDIVFGFTFPIAPYVFCQIADSLAQTIEVTALPTTTGFQAILRAADAGGLLATTATRFNWLAIAAK